VSAGIGGANLSLSEAGESKWAFGRSSTNHGVGWFLDIRAVENERIERNIVVACQKIWEMTRHT
jgi:hypothetical protein